MTQFLPMKILLLFSLVLSSTALAAEPAIKIERDVPFLAPGRAEKLDVYLPAPPPAGKLSPAVVWIHGGGWKGGDKGEARGTGICTTLANAGYVAISINYKIGPGSWPTNLLDCKNGVRFLRAHAAEYHLDPARIAVAGGSAGGHLALMIGATMGKEFEPDAPYAGVSSSVRCVINLYGIANLAVHDERDAQGKLTVTNKLMNDSLADFDAANDDAPVFRVASPITYFAKGAPPVLTFHGKADATVDFNQSELLVRVLKERGIEHEFIALDDVGHTFDWETWNKQPLPRDLRPVALAFLAKHLAATAGR